MQKTYKFENSFGQIIVWRQKINSYQHMYGSALAAFEIGDTLADKLFCLNELAEFVCDWNGVETSDLLDRKKDLYNNSLGRAVGAKFRESGIKGAAAEKAIALECVKQMETNPKFLSHYLDPRVFALTEKQFGCEFLPRENVFNLIGHLFHRR
jgi:hypothetical protein